MPPNVVQTYEVIVQVNYSFNSNLKQCTMYQIYYPFFCYTYSDVNIFPMWTRRSISSRQTYYITVEISSALNY